MKHYIVTCAILFTAATMVSFSGTHAKAGTVRFLNNTQETAAFKVTYYDKDNKEIHNNSISVAPRDLHYWNRGGGSSTEYDKNVGTIAVTVKVPNLAEIPCLLNGNKTLDPHKTPLELYIPEVTPGNPWWETTCKLSLDRS